MRIECNMNEQEFDWWLDMRKKLLKEGYTISRVYRSDEGICIELKPVVLSYETCIYEEN